VSWSYGWGWTMVLRKSERHLLWSQKKCQENDASQCQFYCHNIRHALLQNFFLNQHKRDWIHHIYSIHWTQAITASIHSASKSGNFQGILTKMISWPHKSLSAACHQRINSPKPVVCSIPQDAGIHYSKPIYQLERLIATSSSSSSWWKGKLLCWSWKHSPYSGTFLLFGKSVMFDAKEQKTRRQLSFAPFFVKLTPLAFSISASFSAFFLSNSACLIFSSCAFRNNLIKFSRVVVTAIVKPAPITS